MKTCSACNISLPITSFYSHTNKITGKIKINGYCKPCHNEKFREKPKLLKQYWITQKGDKCGLCLQTYLPAMYDFHHLDPFEKEYSWNKLRAKNTSIIEREMAKTVLLCANCHRLIHEFMRKHWEA